MRLISWNVNGRCGPALPRQLAAVRERGADVVALQEIRAESLGVWREGLTRAGLEHMLDSSDLVAVPSLSGREYRRIYFNVLASRWPLRRLPGLQLEFPERYPGSLAAHSPERGRFRSASSSATFSAFSASAYP